jgi:hypothetical protein
MTLNCCSVNKISKAKMLLLLKEPITYDLQPTYQLIGMTYDNVYIEETKIFPLKKFNLFWTSRSDFKKDEIDTLIKTNEENKKSMKSGIEIDSNSILLNKIKN